MGEQLNLHKAFDKADNQINLENLKKKLASKEGKFASLEEFAPFAEEINAYHQRIIDLQQEFRETNDEETYKKVVDPVHFDDEGYREIANIYMNYLKVVERAAAEKREPNYYA